MRRTITTAIIIIGFLTCCILSKSCANTTTPPSGGPKDTLPPILLKITPDNNTTNFPIIDGKILMLYDEYTVIKTATDIYLSPPQKKRPTAKVKGKNIVVTFNDTLPSDRTFTLDFGQALADNNEGNLAPRLVYSFSTGSEIDSMYITGKIVDCKTLKPVKNVLVALYSDLSDSAVFKRYPDAASKTDEWGFFVLRNIKAIPYNMFAYSDENTDSKYDPGEESIAFLDSTITPVNVVRDSIYELGYFNMKDTLKCQRREATYTLLMFKELQSRQFIKNSGRISEKMGFLTFNAADAQVRSIDIFGIDSSSLIIQYTPTHDSLNFWINTPYKLEDSLLVTVDYKKTDSLGNLSYAKEDIAMALPPVVISGMKKKANSNVQADTAFKLTIKVSNENVEQDGMLIAFDSPIIDRMADSLITFTETNPKNQTKKKNFILKKDTTEVRNMLFFPADKLLPGYDYNVIIPKGMFTNLNNLPNLEAKANFAVPKSDKLSSISLNLSNVDARYIVELIDDKMSSVYRTYHVERDTTLLFPYLKEGKYAVRVTEDRNKNRVFDTGNLLLKRQPERVLLFYLTDEQYIIELPEMIDLVQDIDIKQMFK